MSTSFQKSGVLNGVLNRAECGILLPLLVLMSVKSHEWMPLHLGAGHIVSS